MAFTYIGANVANDEDSDSDVVLTVPTGTENGDLMIVLVGVITPASTAAPSGWQDWPTIDWNGTGVQPDTALYYRLAQGETAGSTTYTFATGTSGDSGLIMSWRGLSAPNSPVAEYNNTHGTGDWGSSRDSSTTATASTGSLADLSIAQPIIYVAHAATYATSGGDDHYDTGACSFNVGTEVFENNTIMPNALHRHWAVSQVIDATASRPAATATFSWSDGALYADGSFSIYRIYGANEAAAGDNDVWGWAK